MFQGHDAGEGKTIWSAVVETTHIVIELQATNDSRKLLLTLNDVDESAGGAQISIDQAEALDFARILKEYGVRGHLPKVEKEEAAEL